VWLSLQSKNIAYAYLYGEKLVSMLICTVIVSILLKFEMNVYKKNKKLNEWSRNYWICNKIINITDFFFQIQLSVEIIFN
jgi:competence protein ComGC